MSSAWLFVVTALGVTAGVTGAGWLTGLGRALRVLLLVLTTVALLPFWIVSGILLAVVLVALATAVSGDDGAAMNEGAAEGIVRLGRPLFGGYYGLLFRQRSRTAKPYSTGLDDRWFMKLSGPCQGWQLIGWSH